MTQEDKSLLLKDLSSRLPYGVILNSSRGNGHLNALNLTIFWYEVSLNIKATRREAFKLEECKPYLRPMSSMTEGEYKEFCKISGLHKMEEGNYFTNHLPEWGNSVITERVMVRTIDWLNAHHFDYHLLIEKGLALEAPEGMYKNKTE